MVNVSDNTLVCIHTSARYSIDLDNLLFNVASLSFMLDSLLASARGAVLRVRVKGQGVKEGREIFGLVAKAKQDLQEPLHSSGEMRHEIRRRDD